jgi:hypothetical protein
VLWRDTTFEAILLGFECSHTVAIFPLEFLVGYDHHLTAINIFAGTTLSQYPAASGFKRHPDFIRIINDG